jgi:hypothetical protein
MANKEFKNIIGTDFPDYVKKQLEERKKVIGSSKRGNKELLWLTNRTGWYRATSFAQEEGIIGLTDIDGLRKKNVLQGGTLNDTRFGNNLLKQGFNETYREGPLGYKPMPGITSLSVGTGGRWQSLLEGDLSFIAYDLLQLDELSRAYMSLGVHVLLEWGHIPFINKDGQIDTGKQIQPLNVFGFKDRIAILQAIEKKRENLGGNYGALLGRVYNFEYNALPDGSYTCNSKIMGPGGMVDSLRINSGIGYDNDKTSDEKEPKYASDLENALVSIRNVANLLLDPKKTFTDKGPTGEIQTNPVTGVPIAVGDFEVNGAFEVLDASKLSKPIETGWLSGNAEYDQVTMMDTLNEIYGRVRAPFTFISKGGDSGEISYNTSSEDNCTTEPDFSEYGNAYQLISGLKNKSNVGLKKIKFDDLFKVYSSTLISTEDEETINASFITLGHLFCLVQHICIIKEENDNESRPCIHIDYHPDNTIARIGIVNASIDPTTCLVEFGGNDDNLKTLLSPLDTNRKEPYDFQPTDATPNNEKNISTGYTDILSGKINPKFRIGTSISEGGRLFNVLVNLDYALKTIEVLKQNSPIRRVAVREYLQAIVDGVDRSLGGLNNFKVTFEDKSQTLRVIDLNYVPEKIDYLTIPPFGKEGIAYDYSYSTKISKELASQVVIASQAQDKGIRDFPDDVLSFNRLNRGVKDALAEKIKNDDEVFGPENDPNFISKLRGPQVIFNQLYNIYSLTEEGKINARLSKNLVTTYNDRQQKSLNQFSFDKKENNIGVLMPLQLTITIDGISGILPYSAFLLPDDRLPARYRGRVAFIVFSINHDFEGNKWTTTLRGQTIMKP